VTSIYRPFCWVYIVDYWPYLWLSVFKAPCHCIAFCIWIFYFNIVEACYLLFWYYDFNFISSDNPYPMACYNACSRVYIIWSKEVSSKSIYLYMVWRHFYRIRFATLTGYYFIVLDPNVIGVFPFVCNGYPI